MIAWVAFVLALLALAIMVAAIVFGVSLYRRAAPTVGPLLSMLAPPPASSSSSSNPWPPAPSSTRTDYNPPPRQ